MSLEFEYGKKNREYLNKMNASTKSTIVALCYVAAIYGSNLYLKKTQFNKKTYIDKKTDKVSTTVEQNDTDEEEEDEEEEDEEEDNKLKRDNPIVIKSRFKFVSITIVLLLLLFYNSKDTLCQLIGIKYFKNGDVTVTNGKQYVSSVFHVLVIYLILYSSQIIDSLLYESLNLKTLSLNTMKKQLSNMAKNKNNGSSIISIWTVRNLIFAPITEEIVFTAMILYNYDFQNAWKLSLYFGIPHLHHAFELLSNLDSTPHYTTSTILFNCLIQFLYTSLFGHINNMIFLKNNQNILCCIVSHSICNYMGFPNLAPLFSINNNMERERQKTISNLYKYFYWSLMVYGLINYINYINH